MRQRENLEPSKYPVKVSLGVSAAWFEEAVKAFWKWMCMKKRQMYRNMENYINFSFCTFFVVLGFFFKQKNKQSTKCSSFNSNYQHLLLDFWANYLKTVLEDLLPKGLNVIQLTKPSTFSWLLPKIKEKSQTEEPTSNKTVCLLFICFLKISTLAFSVIPSAPCPLQILLA